MTSARSEGAAGPLPQETESRSGTRPRSAFADLYEQTRTLLEDFKWLLDQHPEEKGAYSDCCIYEVEEALRHAAETPPGHKCPERGESSV